MKHATSADFAKPHIPKRSIEDRATFEFTLAEKTFQTWYATSIDHWGKRAYAARVDGRLMTQDEIVTAA
jgi:hypothetical protein